MTSERDELVEEKTDLEGKLIVLQSQNHELQVHVHRVYKRNHLNVEGASYPDLIQSNECWCYITLSTRLELLHHICLNNCFTDSADGPRIYPRLTEIWERWACGGKVWSGRGARCVEYSDSWITSMMYSKNKNDCTVQNYVYLCLTDPANNPRICPHLCDLWERWASRGEDWSGREAYSTAVPESWAAGKLYGNGYSGWSIRSNLINPDWQTQLTAQESTLTSVISKRDELAEEKTSLKEELTVLNSQTHKLQVK